MGRRQSLLPVTGHCHCSLWPEPMQDAGAPAWVGAAVTNPVRCLQPWASMGHECCTSEGWARLLSAQSCWEGERRV